MEKPSLGPQRHTPSTTFVQANPNNFKEIVQRLTGSLDQRHHPPPPPPPPPPSPSDREANQIAVSSTSAPKSVGVKKPAFKLHERRHVPRPKLMIVKPNTQLQAAEVGFPTTRTSSPTVLSPSPPPGYTLISPSTGLSNLLICEKESSDTSDLNIEEEEKAIRERRFYLHPSPRSKFNNAEPELLPLFPLSSPNSRES